MTHTLPLVSKHFNNLITKRAGCLWKEGLICNSSTDPYLWEESFSKTNKQCEIGASDESEVEYDKCHVFQGGDMYVKYNNEETRKILQLTDGKDLEKTKDSNVKDSSSNEDPLVIYEKRTALVEDVCTCIGGSNPALKYL